MINKDSTLYKAIEHEYTRIVWTHKIQEKQADIYVIQGKVLKGIKIGASALTTAGVFSLFFNSESFAIKVLTTIVSFIMVTSELCTREFATQALIETHTKAAAELISLRDDYQRLMLKIWTVDISENSVFSELEKIDKRKIKLFQTLPRTSTVAVNLAKKALFANQDNNFVTSEEKAIIPDYLKVQDDK